MSAEHAKAPFPYFGAKSKSAVRIWERLGDPPGYVEPFAGTCAALLARPQWDWNAGQWADGKPRMETVNDSDGLLCNVWRAIQSAPESVAEHADWIVSECCLTARHIALVNQRESLTKRLCADPDWFDPKAAGWWLYGCACWIGSGWCSGTGCWNTDGEKLVNIRENGDAGQGVNRKLVHLGDAGQGVNRQRVHLGNAGQGQCADSRAGITAWMVALSHRLRRVRICCGDWQRVCGETPMIHAAEPVGVFFDPPYADTADRTAYLYANDSLTVAHDVRQWCIEHGDDRRYRIVLAGYDGEHDIPDSWTRIDGTPGAGHGYGGQSKTGYANADREMLWCSAGCVNPETETGLFA